MLNYLDTILFSIPFCPYGTSHISNNILVSCLIFITGFQYQGNSIISNINMIFFLFYFDILYLTHIRTSTKCLLN